MKRCIGCGSFFEHHTPNCSWCLGSHTLIEVPERPRAAHDAAMELTNARELARAQWQELTVPACEDLVLRRGALVVLVGPAGAGKSTALLRWLDSMRAAVLLVSIEMPAGPSLAELFARVGAKREDLYVCSRATIDQIAGIVRNRKIVALGIDSVQRSVFEPRGMRHLLATLPSLAVIFAVSQVNRDGQVRGGEELPHECDVLVEVQSLRWRLVKSRYQPIGVGGDVLPPTARKEESHVD